MPQVSFELPNSIFAALQNDPEGMSKDIRLAAAIYWYERGKISQEIAGQMSGLDRTDFLLTLAKEKKDSFLVDFDDLDRELKEDG